MPLGPEAARRVYDRIGRAQDTQRFYEDAATSRVVELAAFEQACSVFELGCGTGRFAARLLRERLTSDARYVGVDVSPRMVSIAVGRLRGWVPRARVELLDPPGELLPGAAGEFDRFVANYVLELLPPVVRRGAHRGGASTARSDWPSVCGQPHVRRDRWPGGSSHAWWAALASRWPALLGGCTPIELRELIRPDEWELAHREVIERFGITSEIVVAVPRANATDDLKNRTTPGTALRLTCVAWRSSTARASSRFAHSMG